MSNKNKFERFSFFVLSNNTNGAINIPISTSSANPTILASLAIHANRDNVVWLNANVGWRADAGIPNVLFKIWRDAPATGILVYSALEGSEVELIMNYVTSFSHVDDNFQYSKEYLYFLTAEVVVANTTASIRGPVTFTATEIDLV